MDEPRPAPGGQARITPAPLETALSVLIADDAKDGRQLLLQILRHFARINAIEARNGTEAVRLYRDSTPDLVFLDLDMPDMGGLEALRGIRAHDARACVVIVSGFSSAVNVNEALSLGAVGFIVKPYSAGRIRDVLRICEKRQQRSFLIERDA